jgi:hypothetical protein
MDRGGGHRGSPAPTWCEGMRFHYPHAGRCIGWPPSGGMITVALTVGTVRAVRHGFFQRFFIGDREPTRQHPIPGVLAVGG